LLNLKIKNQSKMPIIKNQEDLQKLRHSCLILASLMHKVRDLAAPGVSCGKLDQMANEFIADHKAKPSFKGLYGYPYTLISELNDEVVHGMSPMNKIIPDNCIISFDCGVIYEGLYSDMCILLTFGDVGADGKMLVQKTEESLWAGINQVKAGKRVGDIGHAVDKVLSDAGLGNVLDLGGHGLGYKPHDDPHITHAGKPGTGPRLFENQVIAIEPMVTLGSGEVFFEPVEGSGVEIVRSQEGGLAAHIEHTVLVTKKGHEVLTDIKKEEALS
jgi:methionyl aminopeptidase